jgi:hypothetical protein
VSAELDKFVDKAQKWTLADDLKVDGNKDPLLVAYRRGDYPGVVTMIRAANRPWGVQLYLDTYLEDRGEKDPDLGVTTLQGTPRTLTTRLNLSTTSPKTVGSDMVAFLRAEDKSGNVSTEGIGNPEAHGQVSDSGKVDFKIPSFESYLASIGAYPKECVPQTPKAASGDATPPTAVSTQARLLRRPAAPRAVNVVARRKTLPSRSFQQMIAMPINQTPSADVKVLDGEEARREIQAEQLVSGLPEISVDTAL